MLAVLFGFEPYFFFQKSGYNIGTAMFEQAGRGTILMRTLGGFLIFAAVWLRGAVEFAGAAELVQVHALLFAYGLLFLAGSRMFARWPAPGEGVRAWWSQAWLPLLYLLVQSGLAMALMFIRPQWDFFGLLFIPISLQAVLHYGRGAGLRLITIFSILMALPLLASEEGPLFGLAMTGLYSGMCFLFGGYAHQVMKAEAARRQNQQTLVELQAAHSRLLDYAAQVEELTAEYERNRLARELHDSVTQTVFSMNLSAQSARLLLARDSTKAADQLQQIEALAAGAMREIQTLISQLRPRPAADGLPAALQRLAEERRARDGLEVSLEVSGERQLPDAVAQGLYRIVQEALSNAAKHSGAAAAGVRLDLSAGPACLEITDNGRGFDPQAVLEQRGHLGLAGMAERARELGWELSIDSNPGAGTRIRAVEDRPGGAA